MHKKIEKKVGNQYVLSSIRFLRNGDEFKMHYNDGTNVDLKAYSDPSWDKNKEDWDIKVGNPDFEPEEELTPEPEPITA